MSDETHTEINPLTRLREITSARADGDVLDQLTAAGLVDLGDGLPVRDVLYEAERDGTNLSRAVASSSSSSTKVAARFVPSRSAS